MHNNDANVNITDSVFRNNSVTAFLTELPLGGALLHFKSVITANRCTFDGNESSGVGAFGGGVVIWSAVATLTSCRFESNSATSSQYGLSGGGALCIESSDLLLSDSKFMRNETSGVGGGLCNSINSNARITNCDFSDNQADAFGGGIFNHDESFLELASTTLCSNAPDQILGDWADNGENCIALVCRDSNGDGSPDCHENGIDDFPTVPDEYATIELAIDSANEGAVINIAQGTYAPLITLNPLGKSITIRGTVDDQGNPTTIIDGQGTMRVLQCNNDEGIDTVFENLVISGGHFEYGGGMYLSSASPTLINCLFTDNSAEYGGGMYNTDSNPSLHDCIFKGNSAEEAGGMYNANNSSPTLLGCMFLENSALGGFSPGGGMYNRDRSSPQLINCTFKSNSGRNGGGMYNRDGSEPILSYCVFQSNTAVFDGGGMYNKSAPSLNNCMFTDNSATRGAGMCNNNATDEGETLLYNCLFTENHSEILGGGIFNVNAASPILAYSTVCNNMPDQIIGNWTDNGDNTVSDECPTGCPADFNGDGVVDGEELTYLLGTWGTDDPIADVNGDGIVDGADLNIILAAWGACP